MKKTYFILLGIFVGVGIAFSISVFGLSIPKLPIFYIDGTTAKPRSALDFDFLSGNLTTTGDLTAASSTFTNLYVDSNTINLSDTTDEYVLAFDTGTQTWRGVVATGGYTNLTSFVDQTAWRLFYSNTAGDVTELALGTDGQYLKSAGTTSAPVWDTPGGAGDVVGPASAVNNNVVFFDGTTGKLIKDSGLTLSGSNTGDQDLSGYWDADGDIAADEISESKIAFSTTCGAGNHYYLSGNDLACEADANTTYLGGTNLTLDGTTFNVDDAFVINSGSEVIGGGSGFTWTFDASVGTDPVLTFGDGVINVSAGALQVGGSAVLTTVAYGDLTGNPSDVITAGTLISWSTDTLNVDNNLHNYSWANVVDADITDTLTVTGYMQDEDINTISELNTWVTDATLLISGGTLTDTNLCVADGTSGAIDCNVANTMHAAVTLAGQDYLTLSTQEITAGEIEPDDLATSDFGDFTCDGDTCTLDATYGDVLSVGDCASGACFDGSSDGGTNLEFYNIDSNKTQLIASDTASDLIITLPATTGTLVHSGVATLSSLTSIGTIGTGVWEGTAIADGYIPNNITIDLAASSTALVANGANCNAGSYPLGIDASGAVESCTDATTEINSVVNALGGTNLTCAAQSCNVDDAFVLTGGDDITGAITFSGGGDITLPALSVDAGTYAAGSIDGDDVNSNIAGRSLTLNAASPDTLDADAELFTDTKCIYWEDPVATDDFNSLFYFELASTITRLWCESDQTVTMTIQEDDGTPADIETTDLVCDATPADQTTGFEDAAMAAGSRIDFAVESVAGTPTWCSFCFTYTVND